MVKHRRARARRSRQHYLALRWAWRVYQTSGQHIALDPGTRYPNSAVQEKMLRGDWSTSSIPSPWRGLFLIIDRVPESRWERVKRKRQERAERRRTWA